MAFTIMRVAKLKSISKLSSVGSHNSRTRPTPNANAQIKNEIIINGGDISKTVMEKIKESGARTRSNSVLAQEIFLSASPEFFRPNNPAAAGVYDEKKMQAWKEKAVDWLQSEFGNNVVDCKLHLDESTPHLHAVVVPLLQSKSGQKMRLSARDMFNPRSLKKMQDSYAGALKSLGLKRGIEKSKATHTDIKKFYNAVNSAKAAKMPVLPVPKPMIREKTREKYAEKINHSLHRKLRPTMAQAQFTVIAKKEVSGYKKTAEEKEAKNRKLKEELKRKTDEARAIDLRLILKKFGLGRDPSDRHQFVGGGYRITVKGQKFYDHNHNTGGGGAIDLVKHLQSCNFKEAVAWLGKEVDIKSAMANIRAEAEQIANDAMATSDLTFKAPARDDSKLQQLRDYLNHERKLDPELTEKLIEDGQIYANTHGKYTNAVFVCRNSTGVTGAELKGLDGKFSGMSKGSHRKNGGFCVGTGSNKRAVFTESAIDALSYKQLHPDDESLIISTAGATTSPEYVEKLIEQDWDITVAYDNDSTGQQFAQQWQEQFPDVKIKIPEFGYKDWNERLQAQAEPEQRQDEDRSMKMRI